MPAWAVAIIVAVLAGLLPGWQAARNATKVKRLEDADKKRREDEKTQNASFELAQRVTAEAFERAQRINNEIVAGLREEIARLRKELDDLRHQAITADQRNLEVERKYAAMERSLLRMTTLVRLYVKQLRDAGVDVDDDDLAEEHGDSS